MTRSRLGLFLTAILGTLLLPGEAEAVYLFYMRKDLDFLIRKHEDKIIKKDVVVTDELTAVWPKTITVLKAHEGDERIKQQVESPKDGQEVDEYVLISTTHFRCAIPAQLIDEFFESIKTDAIKGYDDTEKQLREVNRRARLEPGDGEHLSAADAKKERRKLYWQLYRVWKNKPIVTMYGTVMRANFWGKVGEDGAGNGVATEVITLVIHKIEKPRKRWYRTLDGG